MYKMQDLNHFQKCTYKGFYFIRPSLCHDSRSQMTAEQQGPNRTLLIKIIVKEYKK